MWNIIFRSQGDFKENIIRFLSRDDIGNITIATLQARQMLTGSRADENSDTLRKSTRPVETQLTSALYKADSADVIHLSPALCAE